MARLGAKPEPVLCAVHPGRSGAFHFDAAVGTWIRASTEIDMGWYESVWFQVMKRFAPPMPIRGTSAPTEFPSHGTWLDRPQGGPRFRAYYYRYYFTYGRSLRCSGSCADLH